MVRHNIYIPDGKYAWSRKDNSVPAASTGLDLAKKKAKEALEKEQQVANMVGDIGDQIANAASTFGPVAGAIGGGLSTAAKLAMMYKMYRDKKRQQGIEDSLFGALNQTQDQDAMNEANAQAMSEDYMGQQQLAADAAFNRSARNTGLYADGGVVPRYAYGRGAAKIAASTIFGGIGGLGIGWPRQKKESDLDVWLRRGIGAAVAAPSLYGMYSGARELYNTYQKRKLERDLAQTFPPLYRHGDSSSSSSSDDGDLGETENFTNTPPVIEPREPYPYEAPDAVDDLPDRHSYRPMPGGRLPRRPGGDNDDPNALRLNDPSPDPREFRLDESKNMGYMLDRKRDNKISNYEASSLGIGNGKNRPTYRPDAPGRELFWNPLKDREDLNKDAERNQDWVGYMDLLNAESNGEKRGLKTIFLPYFEDDQTREIPEHTWNEGYVPGVNAHMFHWDRKNPETYGHRIKGKTEKEMLEDFRSKYDKNEFGRFHHPSRIHTYDEYDNIPPLIGMSPKNYPTIKVGDGMNHRMDFLADRADGITPGTLTPQQYTDQLATQLDMKAQRHHYRTLAGIASDDYSEDDVLGGSKGVANGAGVFDEDLREDDYYDRYDKYEGKHGNRDKKQDPFITYKTTKRVNGMPPVQPGQYPNRWFDNKPRYPGQPKPGTRLSRYQHIAQTLTPKQRELEERQRLLDNRLERPTWEDFPYELRHGDPAPMQYQNWSPDQRRWWARQQARERYDREFMERNPDYRAQPDQFGGIEYPGTREYLQAFEDNFRDAYATPMEGVPPPTYDVRTGRTEFSLPPPNIEGKAYGGMVPRYGKGGYFKAGGAASLGGLAVGGLGIGSLVWPKGNKETDKHRFARRMLGGAGAAIGGGFLGGGLYGMGNKFRKNVAEDLYNLGLRYWDSSNTQGWALSQAKKYLQNAVENHHGDPGWEDIPEHADIEKVNLPAELIPRNINAGDYAERHGIGSLELLEKIKKEKALPNLIIDKKTGKPDWRFLTPGQLEKNSKMVNYPVMISDKSQPKQPVINFWGEPQVDKNGNPIMAHPMRYDNRTARVKQQYDEEGNIIKTSSRGGPKDSGFYGYVANPYGTHGISRMMQTSQELSPFAYEDSPYYPLSRGIPYGMENAPHNAIDPEIVAQRAQNIASYTNRMSHISPIAKKIADDAEKARRDAPQTGNPYDPYKFEGKKGTFGVNDYDRTLYLASGNIYEGEEGWEDIPGVTGDPKPKAMTPYGEQLDFNENFLPHFGFLDALKYNKYRDLDPYYMADDPGYNPFRGSFTLGDAHAEAKGGRVPRYGYGTSALKLTTGIPLMGLGAAIKPSRKDYEDEEEWKNNRNLYRNIASALTGGAGLANSLWGINDLWKTYWGNRKQADRQALHDRINAKVEELERMDPEEENLPRRGEEAALAAYDEYKRKIQLKNDDMRARVHNYFDVDSDDEEPMTLQAYQARKAMEPGFDLPKMDFPSDAAGGRVPRFGEGGILTKKEKENEDEAVRQGSLGTTNPDGTFGSGNWNPTQGNNFFQPMIQGAGYRFSDPHWGYNSPTGTNPNLQGGSSWDPRNLIRRYDRSDFSKGWGGYAINNVLPFAFGLASPMGANILNTIKGLGTGNTMQAAMGMYPLHGQLMNYVTGKSVINPSFNALYDTFTDNLNQWQIPGVLTKRKQGDYMGDIWNVYRAAGLAAPLLFR